MFCWQSTSFSSVATDLYGAVRLQPSSSDVIRKLQIDYVTTDAILDSFIFNGKQDLDSSIHISIHQIGAARIDFILTTVQETINTRMFQKTAKQCLRRECSRSVL